MPDGRAPAADYVSMLPDAFSQRARLGRGEVACQICGGLSVMARTSARVGMVSGLLCCVGLCLGTVAVAQSAPAVASTTLSWTAPTTFSDGTPIAGTITYNVYAGATPATLAKVLSAVVAGVESTLSDAVCWGAVPKVPARPTNVKCTFTVNQTSGTVATLTANCV